MKREERTEYIGKTWNILNLIWFAMFFSVLGYTVLGLFLKGYVGFEFGEESLNRLRTLFYLLSIGTITYSVYARRSYLRRAGKEKKLEKALEVYRIAVIVSLAISEFIGIFGFLLLVLGDRFYGFPLLITSGLTMLYHRPKRSEILSLQSLK
ncbi:hypothetical protein BCF55_1249 [Hydrogenivirga caldilitoris]|uniref:Uncharacterized protein n=1 Tax=Hydrogenivirga caldilitoris TaxID=246264 RepID=A0A497XS24_9AQUI|nr:hypothetical protein [Hydrogenivirga caldilitoris]RLJ70960.1 hypothetical protein BCF55_1249 [Hydrogenivirga caldilitoris]